LWCLSPPPPLLSSPHPLRNALRQKEGERERLSEVCREKKDEQVRQLRRLQDLEGGLRSISEVSLALIKTHKHTSLGARVRVGQPGLVACTLRHSRFAGV